MREKGARMLTLARRVTSTLLPHGRSDHQYVDMVLLHNGQVALIDPLLSTQSSGYVWQVLTQAEAMAMLSKWPDEPRPWSDGSLSTLTREGRAMLRGRPVPSLGM